MSPQVFTRRDAILATVSSAVGVSDIETEQCREQEQEKAQEQEQEQVRERAAMSPSSGNAHPC